MESLLSCVVASNADGSVRALRRAHRARTACRAEAWRCAGVMLRARAKPPRRPMRRVSTRAILDGCAGVMPSVTVRLAKCLIPPSA